jgi:hypothetical protein
MEKVMATVKENSMDANMWVLELEKDWVESFAYIESYFTPEECENMIKYGNAQHKEWATVYSRDNLASTMDLKIRKNKVSWFFPDPFTTWFYQKLTGAVTELNNNHFSKIRSHK